MARVRQGENSALAELEFAAALVRSGLTPELEPQVRSRQLDCSVEVGSEIVFAEVIAPETSEAIRDAYAAIERVALELVERSKGTHTEILLTVEPDTKFDTIITSATATPPDETVHNVEGTGWVRRVSLASQPPEVAPQIPNPDPRPAIFTTRLRQEDDTITSAMVRLPILDERTHRLLSAELHHFSQAERNILVVRVTSVPGGMEWWLSLTQRWFQPTRNRRVGAVVLYETALIGTPPAVRQRWRIVENPYAYVPVPNELITAIGAVDESSVWSEDTRAV
jgi:hypothetical protein